MSQKPAKPQAKKTTNPKRTHAQSSELFVDGKPLKDRVEEVVRDTCANVLRNVGGFADAPAREQSPIERAAIAQHQAAVRFNHAYQRRAEAKQALREAQSQYEVTLREYREAQELVADLNTNIGAA